MDDQEFFELEQEEQGIPEFIRDTDAGYNIMIRFRNQEDYFKFVDLIGQPKLKIYSKQNVRATTFPNEIDHETSLDQFTE